MFINIQIQDFLTSTKFDENIYNNDFNMFREISFLSKSQYFQWLIKWLIGIEQGIGRVAYNR